MEEFIDLLVLTVKQPTSIALKVESTDDELIATDMGLIAPGLGEAFQD